jgi:Ca2+-binding EF-hand superfamily protein
MKRLTACLFCLAACALAQEPPAAPAPQPAPPSLGRPASADAESGNLLRLSRQMDANGDLLVDEKEFTTGFGKLEKEAAKVHADLLTWLDRDKNGALSPDELRPFYAAVALLPFIRSVDQNGDAALQESELDAAFTRLAEFCQGANGQMLEQFDRNHDGKLTEEELQVARQGLQRVGARGPRAAGGPDGTVVRAAPVQRDRTAARESAGAGAGQP